jgi:hypothetical protein
MHDGIEMGDPQGVHRMNLQSALLSDGATRDLVGRRSLFRRQRPLNVGIGRVLVKCSNAVVGIQWRLESI